MHVFSQTSTQRKDHVFQVLLRKSSSDIRLLSTALKSLSSSSEHSGVANLGE